VGDVLLVVGPASDPRSGSAWSARSAARANCLDVGKGRCRIGPTRAGTQGQRIGTTPRQAVGSGVGMARARGRPALSWSADTRAGDVMLAEVIPHARAAARSFRAGQPAAGRQENCGSWPQLISGVGS